MNTVTTPTCELVGQPTPSVASSNIGHCGTEVILPETPGGRLTVMSLASVSPVSLFSALRFRKKLSVTA